MTTLSTRSDARRRPTPGPERRPDIGGSPRPSRNGSTTTWPSSAPRNWVDYQRYLVNDDHSDAPRIPRHQIEELYPSGAPRSWLLLIERPRQAPWVLRTAAAVISVGLGLATVLSQTLAGAAAGVFAWTGEAFTIALHVIVLLASDGRFGLIGRLIGAAALAGAMARIGWQLARWSSAPIGRNR